MISVPGVNISVKMPITSAKTTPGIAPSNMATAVTAAGGMNAQTPPGRICVSTMSCTISTTSM